MIPPTMRTAMRNVAKLEPHFVDELMGRLSCALRAFEEGDVSDTAVSDWLLAVLVAEAVEKSRIVTGLSGVIDEARRAVLEIRESGHLIDGNQEALKVFLCAHEMQLRELTLAELLSLMRGVNPRFKALQKARN